jgi:uncharacterized protein
VGSLLKYFFLTYAVTWACFIAAAEISQGPELAAHAVVREFLLLLGTFAPALAALAMTAHTDGRGGARALLGRMLHWQVAAPFYLFAIVYMPGIKLSVALAHRLMTGAWPRFGAEPWFIIAVAIIISTPMQAGEEIGWRGYALPRLAARFGFARASLLLGLVWAGWHLPLFFLPGADKYGQSFPVWALQSVALSTAITWLYARTNGSLLLTMLMHSAVNQTLGIVPSGNASARNPFALHASLVMWITAGFLWITAAYFLLRMPKAEAADREIGVSGLPR